MENAYKSYFLRTWKDSMTCIYPKKIMFSFHPFTVDTKTLTCYIFIEPNSRIMNKHVRCNLYDSLVFNNSYVRYNSIEVTNTNLILNLICNCANRKPPLEADISICSIYNIKNYSKNITFKTLYLNSYELLSWSFVFCVWIYTWECVITVNVS